MSSWIRPFHRLIVLLVLSISILTGCTETQPVEEEPESQTEQSQSSEANAFSEKEEEAPLEKESMASDEENQPGDVDATVMNVVDGDTIDIKINGREERVRLLLVDTPETVHPDKPVQPFGPEASDFAKEKLTGKEVRFEYDGPKRDHYDRLLGYVWVNGKNFNQQLLEKGLARYAYEYDPPYVHSAALKNAEKHAQQQAKGIWSIEGYVTDEGFREDESSRVEEMPASSPYEGNLPFDPQGPDRDCSDFSSQESAQAFYEAAGGPAHDPHRLDGHDQDGLVCESL
ncbi:thermonuclease family protein [Halobacillus faecis]|uniref:SPBc2 prophage-derived endonuclease YokF n=1 Tax=Halobacillus faecis TaxID=360184 RepID=A0A511WNW1_9BACI|nr:thermonuclease family protein [Halobacillus faecis]GEN52830.1 SPBc2 prophage-derived endonuclease YokF [Halobacillus faecis]